MKTIKILWKKLKQNIKGAFPYPKLKGPRSNAKVLNEWGALFALYLTMYFQTKFSVYET